MYNQEKIKVFVRCRPLIQREIEASCEKQWKCVGKTIQRRIASGVARQPSHCAYSFDNVFDEDDSNQTIYDESFREIICAAMEGFNGTVFAYGQTASGKTHTISGNKEDPGLIQYGIGEIFSIIENVSAKMGSSVL
ncbi:unnamed protein product [Soboliphyme baturini]|uniref:Kinesin motor domain-containing protein n=1 Tax=Soboliphyme baturini TaxID=241478 RepID=A0A183IW15_9BILA|nr:unnamed protein product [Soboliphyme baturini]